MDSTQYSFMDYEPQISIEDTDLYKLIAKATKHSIREAWRLVATLHQDDIRRRSLKDKSTYLHQIVSLTPEIHKKYSDVSCLIPLIYRLALSGIRVNAQNEHGNTCLHLACLKPHAHQLCSHLIRIGVDPCMKNKKDCRVIHTYRNHQCVIVKGQQNAVSGLWSAVEKEDVALVENLLKSWCRVRVRKNKSIRDVADETANVTIVKLLDKYDLPNEVANTAFACDVPRLKELLTRDLHFTGGVDLNTKDHACSVPKPLLVAVEELGEIARATLKVLKENGAKGENDYEKHVEEHKNAFEDSEFYTLVQRGSTEAILEALELIECKRVDVKLTSHQQDTKGWTYLHFVVKRYIKIKEEDEEKSRLLIRAIYRLALVGIDVNARDASGETALVKATEKNDQYLMTHLLRVGADSSLADQKGRAVNVYVYEDKGKLVFDNKYRVAELPGLWVAVDNNDIGKAERWCKSWARINVRRGDRRLIDIAKALKRQEIVKLLEQYEHINEFVTATFACNINTMKNAIALGNGGKKVNTLDEFFHVGYTWDRHAEFMSRPLIITAMEICTPEVVDFLLHFGANLSKEHEEDPPCGPVAFWAFRDHVNNDNALVVAKHADIGLKDELGATMLHKVIQKHRPQGKVDIVGELLDRGVDLAARDFEGSTARDYVSIHGVPDANILRQTMDDFVLNLVNEEDIEGLENLLVDGYDHVLDIRGLRRNRIVSARDIAELKEYKEIVELVDDWDHYRGNIEILHKCAKDGDLRTISKISSEKRCAWGKDLAGRSLLHNAVLYEHPEVVEFLCEQHPNLINSRDSCNRIPLHICVCLKERHLIWPILQDGGADPNLVEANNMSVYDYVRELETPTPTKDKPRGRRWRDYRPQDVIEWERTQDYGAKASRYELQRHLLEACDKNDGLSDVKTLTSKHKGADLSKDDLDVEVLKTYVKHKREQIVIYLIKNCGARAHVTFEVDGTKKTLKEYAEEKEMSELVSFLLLQPEPQTEDSTEASTEQNAEENTQQIQD